VKTKWQLIREVGMIEARRRGIADKHDQLLFAARELVLELQQSDGVAQQNAANEYGADTALGYLEETLKEFQEGA
jgi:aminoglycoside phosphotransferase